MDEVVSRRVEREVFDKVGGAWGVDEIIEFEMVMK